MEIAGLPKEKIAVHRLQEFCFSLKWTLLLKNYSDDWTTQLSTMDFHVFDKILEEDIYLEIVREVQCHSSLLTQLLKIYGVLLVDGNKVGIKLLWFMQHVFEMESEFFASTALELSKPVIVGELVKFMEVVISNCCNRFVFREGLLEGMKLLISFLNILLKNLDNRKKLIQLAVPNFLLVICKLMGFVCLIDSKSELMNTARSLLETIVFDEMSLDETGRIAVFHHADNDSSNKKKKVKTEEGSKKARMDASTASVASASSPMISVLDAFSAFLHSPAVLWRSKATIVCYLFDLFASKSLAKSEWQGDGAVSERKSKGDRMSLDAASERKHIIRLLHFTLVLLDHLCSSFATSAAKGKRKLDGLAALSNEAAFVRNAVLVAAAQHLASYTITEHASLEDYMKRLRDIGASIRANEHHTATEPSLRLALDVEALQVLARIDRSVIIDDSLSGTLRLIAEDTGSLQLQGDVGAVLEGMGDDGLCASKSFTDPVKPVDLSSPAWMRLAAGYRLVLQLIDLHSQLRVLDHFVANALEKDIAESEAFILIFTTPAVRAKLVDAFATLPVGQVDLVWKVFSEKEVAGVVFAVVLEAFVAAIQRTVKSAFQNYQSANSRNDEASVAASHVVLIILKSLATSLQHRSPHAEFLMRAAAAVARHQITLFHGRFQYLQHAEVGGMTFPAVLGRLESTCKAHVESSAPNAIDVALAVMTLRINMLAQLDAQFLSSHHDNTFKVFYDLAEMMASDPYRFKPADLLLVTLLERCDEWSMLATRKDSKLPDLLASLFERLILSGDTALLRVAALVRSPQLTDQPFLVRALACAVERAWEVASEEHPEGLLSVIRAASTMLSRRHLFHLSGWMEALYAFLRVGNIDSAVLGDCLHMLLSFLHCDEIVRLGSEYCVGAVLCLHKLIGDDQLDGDLAELVSSANLRDCLRKDLQLLSKLLLKRSSDLVLQLAEYVLCAWAQFVLAPRARDGQLLAQWLAGSQSLAKLSPAALLPVVTEVERLVGAGRVVHGCFSDLFSTLQDIAETVHDTALLAAITRLLGKLLAANNDSAEDDIDTPLLLPSSTAVLNAVNLLLSSDESYCELGWFTLAATLALPLCLSNGILKLLAADVCSIDRQKLSALLHQLHSRFHRGSAASEDYEAVRALCKAAAASAASVMRELLLARRQARVCSVDAEEIVDAVVAGLWQDASARGRYGTVMQAEVVLCLLDDAKNSVVCLQLLPQLAQSCLDVVHCTNIGTSSGSFDVSLMLESVLAVTQKLTSKESSKKDAVSNQVVGMWLKSCLAMLAAVAPRLHHGEDPADVLCVAYYALLLMEKLVNCGSFSKAANSATTIGTLVSTLCAVVALIVPLRSGSVERLRCFRLVTRILAHVASAPELNKHAQFVAAAVLFKLSCMGSAAALPRDFTDIVYPGIFALFDNCNLRQKNQMFSSLDEKARAYMTDLHNEFTRTFKFGNTSR